MFHVSVTEGRHERHRVLTVATNSRDIVSVEERHHAGWAGGIAEKKTMQDSMLTMAKYTLKHSRVRKAHGEPNPTPAMATLLSTVRAMIVAALQSVRRRRLLL